MDKTKQPGKLYLDEYKNALAGEIRDLIGHQPDADEFAQMEQYAADYVADCVNDDKLPTLSGLAVALLECRDGYFKRCNECGDWYLYGEFNDGICGDYCLNCKPYRDPDGEPGGWDDLKSQE